MKSLERKHTLSLLLLLVLIGIVDAQHSVARHWNEALLSAIRKDFARPTVHARNLFHSSVLMYDSWSAYENSSDTYLYGKSFDNFVSPEKSLEINGERKAAQEEAMSYAMRKFILYRFRDSPNIFEITQDVNYLMTQLGFDNELVFEEGFCSSEAFSPAAFGNYLADQIIAFGKRDGSNEENDYDNLFYQPVNEPLIVQTIGNPRLTDFNRWQPLEFVRFIGQSGLPSTLSIPEFLSPEWGSVRPFSLKEEDSEILERDGFEYKTYHDPGPPVYLTDAQEDYYQWGFSMVSVWSSHLDTADLTMWDISPASIGNIDVSEYPRTHTQLIGFYKYREGGDIGEGHEINPHTNLPYESNIVKRSDYTRVLAEFWADGPDSETPPGHWFTILNQVNDHPELEKKFQGNGPVLSDLEWDVKSYFVLGGAMHDAAITAWGLKGKYDYIRPVSAIRAMGEAGQSTNFNQSKFSPNGLPLVQDFIKIDDDLDISLYAWRGPGLGVGWIKASRWLPYQRATFVTPPFAGYVSGHSTFSRAAAEVLTAITGDEFFPGGMGVFECPKNDFLVFENGPSENVTLQWATYRDASDQCSLSRIWGGIHPPVDDVPGRLLGIKVGQDAFDFALPYFNKTVIPTERSEPLFFPNPTNCGVYLESEQIGQIPIQIYKSDGRLMMETVVDFLGDEEYLDLSILEQGIYIVVMRDSEGQIIGEKKLVKL